MCAVSDWNIYFYSLLHKSLLISIYANCKLFVARPLNRYHWFWIHFYHLQNSYWIVRRFQVENVVFWSQRWFTINQRLSLRCKWKYDVNIIGLEGRVSKRHHYISISLTVAPKLFTSVIIVIAPVCFQFPTAPYGSRSISWLKYSIRRYKYARSIIILF